jgi:hypothetical protein
MVWQQVFELPNGFQELDVMDIHREVDRVPVLLAAKATSEVRFGIHAGL